MLILLPDIQHALILMELHQQVSYVQITSLTFHSSSSSSTRPLFLGPPQSVRQRKSPPGCPIFSDAALTLGRRDVLRRWVLCAAAP